MRRQQLADIEI